jgi:hypothetical protein
MIAFTIEKRCGDLFPVLSSESRFVATIGQLSGLTV